MDGGDSPVSGVIEVAGQAGSGFLGELKKIGQTAVSQITGSQQTQIPTADEVKKLDKNEQEFKKEAIPEVQARIRRIYEEYAARRRKEEIAKKQQEAQIGEQKEKQEELLGKQQKDMPISAIEKTKAEIKNYGAE